MDKKLLKIGDVSKRLGVSIQSIRYYEKMGLLTPSFIDDDSGYRYYGKKDISKRSNLSTNTFSVHKHFIRIIHKIASYLLL